MTTETNYRHPITQTLAPVIRGMCGHPEALEIQEARTADGYLQISLLPHIADYGILCGSRARQLKAFRIFVERTAERMGIHAKLDLVQCYRGNPHPPDPFAQNVEFDIPAFLRLFENLAQMATGEVPEYEHERRCDRLRVYVRTDDIYKTQVFSAIADILYPYGFKQGMITDIRVVRKQTYHDSATNGTRPFPRH